MMIKSRLLCLSLFFGGLAHASGCSDPQDVCPSCSPGEDVWTCNDVPGAIGAQYFCAPGELEAFDFCENHLHGRLGEKTTCDDQGSGGETGSQASGWDPGAHVYFDSGRKRYVIAAAFFQAVLDEPDQLLFDSARIAGKAGGPASLTSVRAGDLADELGLKSNDELVSLNGLDVSTWDGMLTAYERLHSETTFRLKVRRGGSIVTLAYSVE